MKIKIKAVLVGGGAAAAIAAAVAAVVSVGVPVASADPGQNCRTEWNTMYTVPIGVRTTCFNPDGSYQMCSSLGTAGNGPGTCWSYPAPPAMAGQPTFSPPVPGVPPPDQP